MMKYMSCNAYELVSSVQIDPEHENTSMSAKTSQLESSVTSQSLSLDLKELNKLQQCKKRFY